MPDNEALASLTDAHPASRHLLRLLRDPGHAAAMRLADWDETVRLARAARLLGTLAHRLTAGDPDWTAVPPRPRGHLLAAVRFAAHRRHLMQLELHALEAALPAGMPVVLLKGAAYLAQDLPFGYGRVSGDIDLMVRRCDLDAAEGALRAAGWGGHAVNDYVERYYREWSHELPPMRAPGRPFELDLHHAITPVTSRHRADDGLLFANLVALPDSRFAVLHPADQIVHAVVHLFQDSELDGRLRDLVDIDGLLRAYLARGGSGGELLERARRHGIAPLLWHALRYCRGWLDSPVPADAWPEAPGRLVRAAMDRIIVRTCLPRCPDVAPRPGERLAAGMARVRYHLLRMPPRLLLRHLIHKVVHTAAGKGTPPAAQSRG